MLTCTSAPTTRPPQHRPARGVRRAIQQHPLPSLFLLAALFSWGFWVPLALAGQVVQQGHIWPSNMPGSVGPLLAAAITTYATRGGAGVRDLVAHMGKWRVGFGWAAIAISPLALFALAAGVAAATGGGWPSADAMARFSGLPNLGVLPVLVLLVLAGFGEETGWRGFALPRLQERHGPLTASLILAAFWGAWHIPLFFIVDSYGSFSLPTLVGFFFGMACGSIIFTWLFNGTRGSILVAALFHGCYDLATGSAAASGTIAAVVTTGIILWAFALVGARLWSTHRGRTVEQASGSSCP